MEPKSQIEILSERAEALLFAEGGSMTRKKLVTHLACKEEDLRKVLDALSSRLTGGITLLESDREVALAVSKEAAEAVREAHKRELSHDIGDAGLEVLAIILYLGPSTRAKIDYIRGVNTASTLRTLIARGLLEREGNPDDAREYLYRATTDLLAHLGVTKAEKLPEYAKIASELATFEQEQPHGNGDTANERREGE